MPTAIWGESEPLSDDNYPLSLLKQLLAQMMERFSAQGACLALYDEHIRQMVIRLHLRTPSVPATPASPGENGGDPSSPVVPRSLGDPGSGVREFKVFVNPADGQTVSSGQAADFFASTHGYEGFSDAISFSVVQWNTQRFPEPKDGSSLPLAASLPAETSTGGWITVLSRP